MRLRNAQTNAPATRAHARRGAALMFGFAGPAPLTAATISLYLKLAEREIRPQPVSRANPDKEAQLPPPARLVWEYWDLANWQPLTLLRDETVALTRSGHVHLRGPGIAARR